MGRRLYYKSLPWNFHKSSDRNDLGALTTRLHSIEGKAFGAKQYYHACSGVGSIRMLRGPPIQVVGVALITEFCDHNYSFVEVIFQ